MTALRFDLSPQRTEIITVASSQAVWSPARAGSTRLRTLILAVVTFVVAIPIIWALLLSLKTDTEYASADSSIFPSEPQWDNYREAVTSQVGIPFWDAARNSTVLSVSYSVLAVSSRCWRWRLSFRSCGCGVIGSCPRST